MRLLRLIKLVLVLLSLSGVAVADIGNITTHEGSGEVIRKDGGRLVASLSLDIHSYDDVRTNNGKLEITFDDGSTVKLSANSKLVIDEFVFDPNPKKSKMAFKVAAGTARFVNFVIQLIHVNVSQQHRPLRKKQIQNLLFPGNLGRCFAARPALFRCRRACRSGSRWLRPKRRSC